MPRGIGERDPITGRILGKSNGLGKPDDSDSGPAFSDPDEIGTSPGSGPDEPSGTRAKRPGSGSGPSPSAGTKSHHKAKSPSLDLSSWAGIFATFHVHAAMLAECPELAMTEADAKAYLEKVQNVARHYPVHVTQKGLDIAALIFTTGFMYGPRAYAFSQRLKHGPANKRRPAQPDFATGATVFQFHAPNNGGTDRFVADVPEEGGLTH